MRVFLALCAVVLVSAVSRAQAQSSLDEGYRDMYNLQFARAHQVFTVWQQAHPDDPMGPVSDAAAFLFAEFDRLHILEVEFFVNDRNFEKQPRATPDAELKKKFDAQLDKAAALAKNKLARDPHDANATFAQVLADGLRGDYVALIEQKNMAGLALMKQSRTLAEKLIASQPDYYDAYLAVGVENYLLSLKAAPLRWILHLGGAQTDREEGLKNLKITAEKGHLLSPYARLLLAVAALRDGNRGQARSLLSSLAEQFPGNGLYARELAQLR